ncbi:MAG: hypothetical protein ACI854_002048 [Arenicella sp.]|jgi:uncharacterized protein YaiL (DUF2058 family)
MSLSLKDQLLKAGLAKKAVAKPAKKKKQPQVAKKNRNKPSEVQLRTQRAMLDKAKKDKRLNEQRQAEAAAKAKFAQIKQLVDSAKLDRKDGETPYSFTVKKKVKKIYVTDEQQKQLSRDQIVLISMGNEVFELVPKAVATKIAERDVKYVVNNSNTEAAAPDQDDPYADYQIPDDLTW